MSELRIDGERRSDRARHATRDGRDAAAILARAVRAPALEDKQHLFELAVAADPECAVAWLWLATVTEREAIADARIRTALDLDLGPRAWRDACAELLIAMALRRAAGNPPSACAMLIEAQYVTPRDARVWVALATACTTLPMRLSYLERAIELDGVDRDGIRAAILVAALDCAIELALDGRMNASRDMLVRATAADPEDLLLREIAARLSALAAGRPESPARLEALHTLTSYRASLGRRAGLLETFASSRMYAALVESAATLTASVDDCSERLAAAG